MNFEKKVWVETPYGVKNFQHFHFQKHSPIILKWWAKNIFKKNDFLYEDLSNSYQPAVFPLYRTVHIQGITQQTNIPHLSFRCDSRLNDESIGSPYRNSFFWNFFSPIILGWWGDIFGSENFEKFWPHMGFPSKLFFQNS